jgi:hypothetical protein
LQRAGHVRGDRGEGSVQIRPLAVRVLEGIFSKR